MSDKKCMLIEGIEAVQAQHATPSLTDWSKCVICQEDNLNDKLQCSAIENGGAGYGSLAENLIGFSQLGSLPFNIVRLDEGGGVEESLTNRSAKIHKLCKLKYSNFRLKRAQKRKSSGVDTDLRECAKYTRGSVSSSSKSTDQTKCFFCDRIDTVDSLHEVSTFGMDTRVRKCAQLLQDTPLLAKLSGGDLVAQEAKDHVHCLVSLYNKARQKHTDTKTISHGIVLAELIGYIEEARSSNVVAPEFRLCDLAQLYCEGLKQIGVDITDRVHASRLKERIMAHFPDMQAHKQGRYVLLSFRQDTGLALRKACNEDCDDEGNHLVKAANIVRKAMQDETCRSKFYGSFIEGCQEKSVPMSLLALVEMIINGPNIKTSANSMSQAALSIAQLLQYNFHARRRKDSTCVHHILHNETPLPIYIGLVVHAQTRKRKLVNKLFDLGVSISYDRVLSLSSTLANSVCSQYTADNVVCPLKMRGGLFTTAAVDNIDHNPSSTTAKDSFHGTGISLFQHPTADNPGTDRSMVLLDEFTPSKTIVPLPDSYVSITPVVLKRKDVPISVIPVMPVDQSLPGTLQTEHEWLEYMEKVSHIETLNGDEHVSWAAYHAKQQPEPDFMPNLTSLLPLFRDDSKSVAMIRHSMDVVKSAVDHVNPGQVPCITLDQPLYALAKEIQWCWPSSYGEDKFVVILGGLHTEMTLLKCLGTWLEDSGWTSAISQAEIATPGVADSILKASHVTRARHAHQVTASSLYILLHRAYAQFHDRVPTEDTLSFDSWVAKRVIESPQFQYWHLTLQLELLVLVFVRSVREGDFQLYIESLTKLVPWLFALDHTNYARWLPVHILDMISLQKEHPNIFDEFVNGNFVIHKTKHRFSAMAIDQAHEQNNALVKGDGGVVGLTENPAALSRWMTAGPEVARLVTEFEDIAMKPKQQPTTKHHEQTTGVQVAFHREVKSLVGTIEEFGNPFCEDSEDLLVLDSKNIANADLVKTVREIQKLGENQYQTFLKERLQKRTKSLYDRITRNQLTLFRSPTIREVSTSKLHLASLKNDVSLFSRLYIACQVRDGNLDTFFQHENQASPPSLSLHGQLRQGTKSDLIDCLEEVCSVQTIEHPTVDAMILDGAAIINMLKPGAALTFNAYAESVFMPFLLNNLQRVKRLDIAWDQYFPNSIKATARAKRGKGVRRRVAGDTKIPSNWPAFLRIDDNKTELFMFLADKVTQMELEQGKQVFVTQGKSVLANPQRIDNSSLSPCTHEEADTRIFLHVADALNTGHKKIAIRTVDTDVVVIAVSLVRELKIAKLWVAFGTGKKFRYIAVHAISEALGEDKSKALPVFHSFTGCDTVSAFNGRGKRSAWETWKAHPDATKSFLSLSAAPQEVEDNVVATLEGFVVLLYDRTSGEQSVDVCRKHLFTSKGRGLEGIPPTKGALLQHTKRAAYQAGHIWGQSLIRSPEEVPISEWGWEMNTKCEWQPLWCLLPEASRFCHELLKCGCKKGCQGNCKCSKANLKCTALCNCHGECSR